MRILARSVARDFRLARCFGMPGLMLVLAVAGFGCSKRLTTAPGGPANLRLELHFPAAVARGLGAGPLGASATQQLDSPRVSVYESLGGRDSVWLAGQVVRLAPGASEFKVGLRAASVPRYGIRVETYGLLPASAMAVRRGPAWR